MCYEILYFICQNLFTGRVQKGKHGSLTIVPPSVIANVNDVKMFGSLYFHKLVSLNDIEYFLTMNYQ